MTSVEKTNQVISNQFFYKTVDQYAPRYKYVKVLLSNILGTAVAITATGTQQIQFKMPYNCVYNLAKSKLFALVPLQAQTTNVYSQITSDCFPFGNQLVSFETGNGLQLCNLIEPARYTKILRKMELPITELLTRDITDFPYPCNNSGAGTSNATSLNTIGSVAYLEPQYYQTSENIVGAVANNCAIQYELSNFSNTILSLDKDVYFGQNDMYLKITIDAVNKWAFQTSTASPGTGTITTLTPTIGSLQNVYLYLAVETNPILIDRLVGQFNSGGLRLQIDYPFITKTTVPASASQAVVVPLVPAQGKFLRRILTTVWNSTDNFNLCTDCENWSGQPKVLSFNTYLDQTKLQDDLVYTNAYNSGLATTLITQDDWRINQPFCQGSTYLNYAVYQKNWFHCDDFSNFAENHKISSVVPEQNIRDGLPMERGVQFQVIATTTNASYIWDIISIFIRDVHISNSGVTFV